MARSQTRRGTRRDGLGPCKPLCVSGGWVGGPGTEVTGEAEERARAQRGQGTSQQDWVRSEPLWKQAGAFRQVWAWDKELTFELKLVGKGLHLDGKAVEVEHEEVLQVLQLLGAEVPLGPGPQEDDGAQDTVPAVRLQLTQPA